MRTRRRWRIHTAGHAMAPTWGSKRRSPRPLPAVVSLFGDDAAADAMPAGQPVRKLREEDAAASQECPTARAHNTGRQPPQASAQHRAAATTIDSGSLHSPFADNLPAPAPGHVPHKLLAPLEPYSCTCTPPSAATASRRLRLTARADTANAQQTGPSRRAPTRTMAMPACL